MSHFYKPPPPFIGGRQPLEGRKRVPVEGPTANDPPFDSRRAALLAAIVGMHYNIPTMDISTVHQNPVEVAAEEEKVPYTRADLQVHTHNAWLKNELPQEQRKIAPLIPAAAQADDPPLLSRNRFDPIYSWYEYKQTVDLWTSSFNPVEPPPAAVNDPPFGQRRWMETVLKSWDIPVPRQPEPRKLPIPSVDPPPGFETDLYVIPEPFYAGYYTRKQIAPVATPAAPQVDNPPFDSRRLARLQDQSWHHPTPIPQQTRPLLVQPFVPAQVDNPPPTDRKWLYQVLHHWHVLPDRLPEQFYKVKPQVQPGAAPEAPNRNHVPAMPKNPSTLLVRW